MAVALQALLVLSCLIGATGFTALHHMQQWTQGMPLGRASWSLGSGTKIKIFFRWHHTRLYTLQISSIFCTHLEHPPQPTLHLTTQPSLNGKVALNQIPQTLSC